MVMNHEKHFPSNLYQLIVQDKNNKTVNVTIKERTVDCTLACENNNFSSLLAAWDVSQGEDACASETEIAY